MEKSASSELKSKLKDQRITGCCVDSHMHTQKIQPKCGTLYAHTRDPYGPIGKVNTSVDPHFSRQAALPQMHLVPFLRDRIKQWAINRQSWPTSKK